ncbi:MAG: putative metal-binding motif-containing protein [Deltaproteobacteria bacterium]|nr:putative metal-binding motif-containing protein [Deltaproteobacteria bacterium]
MRFATGALVAVTLAGCAAGNTTPATGDARPQPPMESGTPTPVPPPGDGGVDAGDGDVTMDPCFGVTCPAGRVCNEGVCELDGTCVGISCMSTEICVPGRGCIPLAVDEDGDGATVGGGDCDDRDPNVRPMAPERCNAIDDDCDGDADEGDPGGGAMCNTGMSGPCGPGVQRCTRGEVTCVAAMPPGTERCNGEDDDCDGMTDEGNPGGGGTCATGMQGACGMGEQRCQGGTVSCVQTTMARTETCDGRDDDCDGATDEDDPGGGGMCSTGMAGRCAEGVSHCRGGAIACEQLRMPEAETCNREDDDCDGATDEDIDVHVIETTFATLAGHHDGCTGFGSRVDACASAIHRLCAAESTCAPTAGVGPFDTGSGRPSVACISGASMHVSFADLSGAQPPCDGDGVAHLDVCWSAAHRLCQMRGHRSGYGPIEHSGGEADIVCVGIGEIVEVPFSTLGGFHPGCDESVAVSLACNTAIHRFCAGRMGGRGSGYGAIEHSAGMAYVVCVGG